MHDIESQSLPAHVSLCQERYSALVRRMDSIDSRIDEVETLVREINKKIDEISVQGQQRWTNAQIGVIGVLLSITGFLAARIFS